MSIKLISAKVEDLVQLCEIGRKSYQHHFAHLWTSPTELHTYLDREYSLHSIKQDLLSQQLEWFVIRTTQSIGLVKLSYQQPIPNCPLVGTLINKIYFLPQFTGQGYGEQIVKQIEKIALNHGDQHLWLEVLTSNLQAQAFYQKCAMQWTQQILFQSGSQQIPMDIFIKTLC